MSFYAGAGWRLCWARTAPSWVDLFSHFPELPCASEIPSEKQLHYFSGTLYRYKAHKLNKLKPPQPGEAGKCWRKGKQKRIHVAEHQCFVGHGAQVSRKIPALLKVQRIITLFLMLLLKVHNLSMFFKWNKSVNNYLPLWHAEWKLRHEDKKPELYTPVSSNWVKRKQEGHFVAFTDDGKNFFV